MQNLEADVERRHWLPHISWHSREANGTNFYKYSLNIPTWCISPCHAPVRLSGLLSFTCRSCVAHAAPLFVQTNMIVKLTDTPVSSRRNKKKKSSYKHISLQVGESVFQNVFHICSFAKSEFYKLAQMYGYITLIVHSLNKKLFHCC